MDLHKINLHIGETYEHILEGLGSAGYAWIYTLEGQEGILAVSIESLPSPFQPQAGLRPPDTFNVQKMIRIEALKSGIARVHLSLRRPWEVEKTPLREIEIEVTVSNKERRTLIL